MATSAAAVGLESAAAAAAIAWIEPIDVCGDGGLLWQRGFFRGASAIALRRRNQAAAAPPMANAPRNPTRCLSPAASFTFRVARSRVLRGLFGYVPAHARPPARVLDIQSGLAGGVNGGTASTAKSHSSIDQLSGVQYSIYASLGVDQALFASSSLQPEPILGGHFPSPAYVTRSSAGAAGPSMSD